MYSLFTKSGLNGNSFAAFGPTPGDDRASLLGLHADAEAVRLRATAAIGLESTFRQSDALLSWVRKLPPKQS